MGISRARWAALAALALLLSLLPAGAFAGHPAGTCIDLAPETQTVEPNTQVTITATLRTLEGQNCTGAVATPTGPLQVVFQIQGPNGGDAQPDATCTIPPQGNSCEGRYTPTATGTDTVTGFVDENGNNQPDGNETSDEVTVTVQTAGPVIPQICQDTPGARVGTDASEVIEGTANDDVICALGGDDLVRGLGGNDTILAGAGNDLVVAGDGNDIVKGGGGNDSLQGGAGDDQLSGGGGADYLMGGGGKDTLRGGKGNDFLDGGRDADRCRGGTGRNRLMNCRP